MKSSFGAKTSHTGQVEAYVAYQRGGLWEFYTAFITDPDKLKFTCLWNRQGGEGPGGTQHMFETVQKYSGAGAYTFWIQIFFGKGG